jgi:hypothetical protein
MPLFQLMFKSSLEARKRGMTPEGLAAARGLSADAASPQDYITGNTRCNFFLQTPDSYLPGLPGGIFVSRQVNCPR